MAKGDDGLDDVEARKLLLAAATVRGRDATCGLMAAREKGVMPREQQLGGGRVVLTKGEE